MTIRPGSARNAKPRGFSDEESFGLFMEAVRELQMYEDEATKIESEPSLLLEHLRDALDALDQCYRSYPDDLLPRYYLGIALTMENQCFYATLLRERQQVPDESESTAPSLPIAPPLLWAQSVDQTDMTTPLPALQDRPWPLLDRALDCFDRKDNFALIPELKDAALFNSANVYVRMATPESFKRAIEILKELKARSTPRPPSRLEWLTAWARSERQERREDEERAFAISSQILLSTANGLSAIRERKKSARPDVELALMELARCRDAGAQITDPAARHDLFADGLVKEALLKYLFAVSERPWETPTLSGTRLESETGLPNSPLVDAAADLREALQHKSNWIPAQIYLAQVYQALGRGKAAAQLLSLVLGKPPKKERESAA